MFRFYKSIIFGYDVVAVAAKTGSIDVVCGDTVTTPIALCVAVVVAIDTATLRNDKSILPALWTGCDSLFITVFHMLVRRAGTSFGDGSGGKLIRFKLFATSSAFCRAVDFKVDHLGGTFRTSSIVNVFLSVVGI